MIFASFGIATDGPTAVDHPILHEDDLVREHLAGVGIEEFAGFDGGGLGGGCRDSEKDCDRGVPKLALCILWLLECAESR